MKKACLSGLLLASLALLQALGEEEPKERYFVVCVTDIDKSEKVQVMTPDEMKSLNDEIKAESVFFSRAVDNARVQWSREKELQHKSFPKGSIWPRKADKIGSPYSCQSNAVAKVKGLEKEAQDRLQRKQARENERNKGRPAPKVKDNSVEVEKQDLLNKAVALVRTELDKLREAAAAKTPAGAPANP